MSCISIAELKQLNLYGKYSEKQKRLELDISKEKNRHLRAKIAEVIYEHIRDKLSTYHLDLCGIYEFRDVLMLHRKYGSIASEIIDCLRDGFNLMDITLNISKPLDELRQILKIKIKEHITEIPFSYCILCLSNGSIYIRKVSKYSNRENEGLKTRGSLKVPQKEESSFELHFYLCEDCAKRCLEKGYIKDEPFGYTTTPKFAKFENQVRIVSEKIERVWPFLRDLPLERLEHILKILLKFTKSELDFLYEVYTQRRSGQLPFDFIAVGDGGVKYLIDVTSVRKGYGSADLSPREREVAERAKKLGFRILMPVIEFKCCRVTIELKDV